MTLRYHWAAPVGRIRFKLYGSCMYCLGSHPRRQVQFCRSAFHLGCIKGARFGSKGDSP